MTGLSSRVFVLALIVVATCSVASAWAADPTPAAARAAAPRIVGVLVTDQDPVAALASPADFLRTLTFPSGPFDGYGTHNLYVVTVYSPRGLSDQPFEQVARFVLPDGAVYQAITTTVQPGESDGTHAGARVQSPMKVGRLARSLALQPYSEAQLSRLVFTTLKLPVSGTWITQHNLYGTWAVEVAAQIAGAPLSGLSAAFEITAPQQ
jgi:hypothetical protein